MNVTTSAELASPVCWTVEIPVHPDSRTASTEDLLTLHWEILPVVKKLSEILRAHREKGVVPERMFVLRHGDTVGGHRVDGDHVVIEPIGPDHVKRP